MFLTALAIFAVIYGISALIFHFVKDRKKKKDTVSDREAKERKFNEWQSHRLKDADSLRLDNSTSNFKLSSKWLPGSSLDEHTYPTHSEFIGESFIIDYTDAQGDITRRRITIKEIYHKNSTDYIKAHCHLRHEERTFIIDRINGDIINTSTGELLDPDMLRPI